MADDVRSIYDASKRQDKVIFQQNKPLLNYELNLVQDILKNRVIDLTQLSIANNYSGDALKIAASNLSNEVWLRKGIFYHLGRPIQIFDDLRITGLSTPLADRTDIIYVEWFLEEVNSSVDPNMKDPILGFETAVQDRLNVSIRVVEGSDTIPVPPPAPPSAPIHNFFPIALLNRQGGNSYITDSMIQDERDKVVYNYVVWGCHIADAGGLDISISEGDLFVGDTDFYIEDTTPVLSLAPSATSYVYVEKVSGYVVASATIPMDYHVMLAEVWTDATDIVNLIDRRNFRPIAWNNKYGGSEEGETGFPSISEKYKAGEDISKYDVVYISGSKTVSKASASSLGKLPCIGIAPQSFASGQIDNIIVFGQIANPAWSWSNVGGNVYLNIIDGSLTQTPPTVAETYVQRIGVAVSSTILFFNPDRTYIKNKTAATAIVVLRANGDLEVMEGTDKISPSSLSFFAPMANDPNNRTFTILEGLYYINDTEYNVFPETVIDMGTGIYQTTAIPASWYNKAAFTLRDDNTVQMYESAANSVSGFVVDPELPDNELPVCIVTFQDDGSAGAGTILPIAQADIYDIRDWLNMGNLDNTAFKPFYENGSSFIIQKGSAWFNNEYLTLSTNTSVTGDISTNSTYYIYLDYNLASGGVTSSSFVTMTTLPSGVNRRRFIPLGQYTVVAGNIDRSTLVAYKSKFWQFRDAPYSDEQIFDVLAPQTVFTVTNFSFLDSDYLDITINGIKTFEGASSDYTKNYLTGVVTFNYTVKIGAEVRIRKV